MRIKTEFRLTKKETTLSCRIKKQPLISGWFLNNLLDTINTIYLIVLLIQPLLAW